MEQTVNRYEIAFTRRATITTPCKRCGCRMKVDRVIKKQETEDRYISCENDKCDERAVVVTQADDGTGFLL